LISDVAGNFDIVHVVVALLTGAAAANGGAGGVGSYASVPELLDPATPGVPRCDS